MVSGSIVHSVYWLAHCCSTVAGISPGKLVEAHGSFSTASCIKCKSKQEPEEVKVCGVQSLAAKYHTYTLVIDYLDHLNICIKYLSPLTQAAIFDGKVPRCKYKYCMVSSNSLAYIGCTVN